MSAISLESVKEKHRTAARMIVAGMPDTAIASVIGVQPATISGWKKQPLFEGLVTQYRLLADNADQELALARSGVGRMAFRALERRLEDNEAEITVRELTDIIKITAPVPEASGPSTQINLIAERMEAASARVARQRQTIDVTAKITSDEPAPAAGEPEETADAPK